MMYPKSVSLNIIIHMLIVLVDKLMITYFQHVHTLKAVLLTLLNQIDLRQSIVTLNSIFIALLNNKNGNKG